MPHALQTFLPTEVHADIPETLIAATDSAWLEQVLAPLSGGAKVESVELTDVIKAMAAKVRLAVTFAGEPATTYHLCLKGFLDHDLPGGAGGLTTLREADFYLKIAPHLAMETPHCPIVVTQRDKQQCVFVMEDMIHAGTHFFNALEPFNVDQTAETLEQLARLHVASPLLREHDWIPCRIEAVAGTQYLTPERLQELMLDERRGNLPEAVLSAERLLLGLKQLARWNADQPQTLLHGDCHPGNVYRTAAGKLGFTDWQLIQRGHWSLDVAYHLASVLPEAVAEQHEAQLLKHYLEAVQKHGGNAVDFDTAWLDYRRAQVYGYYQWAITQRVHPPITHQAFRRLGAAVARHGSYELLAQQRL